MLTSHPCEQHSTDHQRRLDQGWQVASKRPNLRSGFTLGGEQAEADALLEAAFYESSDYKVIESREDRRCFVVGRTGSGKSAALQRLEEVHPDHVIRISPEDLSLPYITNLHAIRYLDSLEINLDTFWTTLWKHVLLVEIIRHRYKVNNPAAKQSFLSTIRDRISNDQAKRAALEYLDEYEGRFWCEADERVREITDNFTRKFDLDVGLNAGGGPGASRGGEESTQTKAQQVDRFQRIVNDTQLARLNKMMTVLDEDVLDSSQHYTYVVIDDLDRDWVDERIANDLIRCLFRTVLDLKRVQNLKVLVALRSNIFQELDFGRRGGGQEEKFRALVLQMRWTRFDLEGLLNQRVHIAGERVGLTAHTITELLPNANNAMGKPLDYLLDRTLLRPRDAIAFANECLGLGIGKPKLAWVDIKNAEQPYSEKRLMALRDEWKETYPGIDKAFSAFRRSPARMSKQELTTRLDEIMLLPSTPTFEGVRWMTNVTSSMWASGPDDSWFDLYQPVLRLLFVVGFLGCEGDRSKVPVFFQDNPLFVDHESNIERADAFFVHRTYHAGLDIRAAGERP